MRPSPVSKPTMTAPLNDVEPHAPVHDPGLAAVVVFAMLGAYKLLLSPLFTGSCRFQPSCADYMADAVRFHGAARGVWLGLRRLSRCHPLGSHGFDPVPPPSHTHAPTTP